MMFFVIQREFTFMKKQGILEQKVEIVHYVFKCHFVEAAIFCKALDSSPVVLLTSSVSSSMWERQESH